MTTHGPIEPDDLSMVADADALLDALAAGVAVDAIGDEQATAALLSAWRVELGERAATAMTTTPATTLTSGPRHWIRVHRKTAAATALFVAIAGSTGAAAAASSPTGPLGGLHKLFYGDSTPTHHLDAFAADAKRLLDEADRQIEAAQAAGSITSARQNTISGELDTADGFLKRDALAPNDLLAQLNLLRDALARIPLAAEGGVSPGTDERGDHEGENGGGDDQGSSGRGGDDSGRGSDDQGEDSGSSKGSDSGSDGDSSDDGSTRSGAQDSGDDDGVVSRDGGSGSGVSGDDGSSSGSDDGSGGDDSEDGPRSGTSD